MCQGQRKKAQGGGHRICGGGFQVRSACAGQQIPGCRLGVKHVHGQFRAEGVVAAAVTRGDQHPAVARVRQFRQRARPRGVVEHQEPPPTGVSQVHQRIAGPLGRGALRDREAKGHGQLGQVGGSAILGPYPGPAAGGEQETQGEER